jgi:adenosylcobinamide kinase/adenosylcobinamide-phosphate guanylyltransferase
MGKIIFITGGARSGKSSYAQKRAEAMPGPRLYLATCPPPGDDQEMRARIDLHIKAREDRGWTTVEEPLLLPEVIKAADSDAVEVLLIDCLTLWLSNLLQASPEHSLQEAEVEKSCLALLAAAAKFPGTVFLVSNEVGFGIVPDNALARRFRDLVGRCNQIMAAGADEAVLVTCGLPLWLKNETKQKR